MRRTHAAPHPALLTALALLAVTSPGRAQATPPGTDIHLADLSIRAGRLLVAAPRNVTGRPGYDNQPSFSPDGRSLYYTSIHEDGQADIYRHDLASGTTARITRTPESEYSPTPLPAGDGLSVVRVEADSTQRLWRFSLEGTDPRVVLADVRPVGYHAWGDPSTLALFVLGDPPTLRLADARTGQASILAEDIGRSLHRVPGRNAVSFLQRQGDDAWVMVLDLATREATSVVRALGPGEDYAWMPDGSVLMGRGSRLFRFDPARDEDWREIVDLGRFGIDGITRLAVSPDGSRLAFVAAEPAR